MQSGAIAQFEILPWDKNFETGIKPVDKQHKRLVFLLNRLASYLGRHTDHIELNQVFSELAEYAEFHFKAEEEVWRPYFEGGDWLASHRQVHDSFMARVAELKGMGEGRPLDEVVEDILRFLTGWLALHILDGDMRMAKAVHGINSGLSVDKAKAQADLEMQSSMGVLVETLLGMYDTLSVRTLEMMRELETRAEVARQALVGVVGSVSKALEARDPYTAGHQQRVADIAVEIAGRMGLDGDHIEGIRLGASIHDIGKLAVPVDLLTKPTRLNELEYALIQSHAQRGLDILKGVSFPWAIAEIVCQHHERLDGSGYPAGLKGDEIALEARIVAVADVFEAMSAHRPYRAALGVALAVEELKKHRGSLYDAHAVDALLALLEEDEQRFQV